MTASRIVPAALCLLMWTATGCDEGGYGRQVKWSYSFTDPKDENRCILDCDGFTMVFEGVRRQSNSGGDLTVAGPDTSPREVGVGPGLFRTHYQKGVNTMRFAGHTIEIADEGWTLRFNGQSFKLDGPEKKIFVVRGNDIQRVAIVPPAEKLPSATAAPAAKKENGEAAPEAPARPRIEPIREFQD